MNKKKKYKAMTTKQILFASDYTLTVYKHSDVDSKPWQLLYTGPLNHWSGWVLLQHLEKWVTCEGRGWSEICRVTVMKTQADSGSETKAVGAIGRNKRTQFSPSLHKRCSCNTKNFSLCVAPSMALWSCSFSTTFESTCAADFSFISHLWISFLTSQN